MIMELTGNKACTELEFKGTVLGSPELHRVVFNLYLVKGRIMYGFNTYTPYTLSESESSYSIVLSIFRYESTSIEQPRKAAI